MSHSLRVPLLLTWVAPALTGCFLGTGVPFSIDAPAQQLDVDAERARLEAELCADSSSADCAVLAALDASDGEASTPPSLLSSLPVQVQVPAATPDGAPEIVEVAPWLSARMAEHGLVPAQSFPLAGDAASMVRDAVKRASLEEAAFVFEDNQLNLDLPPFEVWVGSVDDADVEDAIAAGALERIAVTDALPAGTDQVSTLIFSDGGSDRLLAAVRDGDDVAVRADPAHPLVLGAGEAPETLARPAGHVALCLRLSGSIAIPVEQLVEQARQ